MTAPLVALLLAAAPAAPSVALVPASARPGDAVLVAVSGAAAAPEGTLGGRALRFWRDDAGWRALAPLPTETPPGPLAVDVTAGGEHAGTALPVVEPSFRSTVLSVPPRFVEPPPAARLRIAADRKAFEAAFAQPFAPPLFSAPFARPREAGTTGRFGDQRVYNGEKQGVHYGLDLRGAKGAPVLASNDGEVVLVRDAYMSGRSIVLWHGAGVYSVYFHLSRVDVHQGMHVRRGDRLGAVGATGRANGPHLHWGIKVDGLYVDPESMLRFDVRSATAIAAAPRAAAPPAAPVPASAPARAAAPGPSAAPGSGTAPAAPTR